MVIEVFKAGTHEDSRGNARTWTESDLDEIVRKYNEQKEHEAPVVIGHPKDNAPAYGWVERLERKGSVLYAKLRDLAPEFIDWVKKGLYKKRSISLYPDLTLRHVGFLGAVPPAVKGLADVQFSGDDESLTIEFSDYRMNTIGSIFLRLREWLIEKFGTDTADRVVSSWEIDDLKRQVESEEGSTFKSQESGKEELGMDKIRELEEKLKAEQQQFAEKLKEVESLRLRAEEEAKTLKAEVEKIQAEKRKSEFNAFCEGLIKEGRLTPAMKPVVMDFMEILYGVGEYEFAEGEEGRKPASAVEKFKGFLSALPKQVEFSEMATKDKAVTCKGKWNELIADYMEKNKDATYKEAFKAVAQKHPEAFEV